MREKLSTLLEKAKILADGGITEISGVSVILGHEPYIFDPCSCCDLERLCYDSSDIFILCKNCDTITREDCFLITFEK